MSPFTPRRFQTTSQEREPETKLRMGGYPQENESPVYERRHQDTQKLKNLSFWKNIDQEEAEEEEWSERQSFAPFILAIVILVIASSLLWFLFQWASSENTNAPLVIPADTAPFKVRPENPGGLQIPHQDKLIYGRFGRDSRQPMERLLPPPEQPMMAPSQQQPMVQAPLPLQRPSYYPQGQNYTPVPQSYPSQSFSPPPPLQGGQQPAQFQQPQPYPSASGQAQAPYGQQRPLPSPSQSPAYAPASQPSYAPPSAPPVIPKSPPSSGSGLKSSTVENIKPASDQKEEDDFIPKEGYAALDRLIAEEAKTPLKRVRKKNLEKAPKLKGLSDKQYRVQVASLSSRSMAEQEIKRLQTRHALLRSKSWAVQKINLRTRQGPSYRLLVGPFSTHNAASKACAKLRSEKKRCLVIAPTHK